MKTEKWDSFRVERFAEVVEVDWAKLILPLVLTIVVIGRLWARRGVRYFEDKND